MQRLAFAGQRAVALHGGKAQQERLSSLERFASSEPSSPGRARGHRRAGAGHRPAGRAPWCGLGGLGGGGEVVEDPRLHLRHAGLHGRLHPSDRPDGARDGWPGGVF